MLLARASRLGSRAGIERVRAAHATIPTDAPESDGTLEWDRTTIVVVEVSAGGKTGLGYTYADRSAAGLVERLLAGKIAGLDALDVEAAWQTMTAAVRNQDRRGLASMAVSAVDAALWDLKGKLLDASLLKLLGAARERVPAYGSGGFTSYSLDELSAQLEGWVKDGLTRVKMKVGREPRNDPGRVHAARRAIGPEAQLFVDANGAYGRKQACALAEAFTRSEVSWLEEPVTQEDLEGLRYVRDRLPDTIELAAGEYASTPYEVKDLLEAKAVDVLQVDATRFGGVTGFMKANALCESFGVPLSSHTAPSLHAPLGCAGKAVRHIEYFHDHVRIERMLFDGAAEPKGGYLTPDVSRPGLGLSLRRGEARRHGLDL